MLIVIKINIMSIIKLNNKIRGMIPDTFIHKYNNLCIKDDNINVNLSLLLGPYRYSTLILNPKLDPSHRETLIFKVNYIKRLQLRQKVLKILLNKIFCEDMKRIILRYIGFESPIELFNIFIQ